MAGNSHTNWGTWLPWVMIAIATIPAAWDYLGLGRFWNHLAPAYLR